MADNWWVKQGYGADHPVYSAPGAGEVDQDSADNSDIPEDIPQSPAKTSNPARPRTQSQGYDAATKTLQVTFRQSAAAGGETAVYNYYDVEPALAAAYLKSSSPGKFINRNLAGKAYGRVQ